MVNPVASEVYKNWKQYGFEDAPVAVLYLAGIAVNNEPGFRGIRTPEQLLEKHPINVVLGNATDYWPTCLELSEGRELGGKRTEKYAQALLFLEYLYDSN